MQKNIVQTPKHTLAVNARTTVKKKKNSIDIVSGAKFAAKCPFSPNSTVTKPSKSSSESELSVHCCRAAVKTRRNSKECRPKLDENEIILLDIPL